MRRVVITAVLAPLIAVLVAGCGDGDELSPSREEGTPSRTVMEIGQRVVVPGFPDMWVESFRRSTDAADVSGEVISYTLEAGEELLMAVVRLLNDSDSPMFINRVVNFNLISDGEVLIEGLALLAVVDGGLEDAELPPGAEATGLVVWRADRSYTNLALLYRPFGPAGEASDPEFFIVALERN